MTRRRALLPADDSGHGFDNIGDVLTVSPGLMARYLPGSPPPPPDIPALVENDEGGAPATVRARMEQHRSNPACAACHRSSSGPSSRSS